MTTRILPVEEWGVLEGHPVLGGYPVPAPGAATFIVTEDGDRIVGVQGIVQVLHLEPIWIDPAYRGGRIGEYLWRLVRETLATRGVRMAFAFANRDDIRDYLTRLGLAPTDLSTFLYEGSLCRPLSSPQESLPPPG